MLVCKSSFVRSKLKKCTRNIIKDFSDSLFHHLDNSTGLRKVLQNLNRILSQSLFCNISTTTTFSCYYIVSDHKGHWCDMNFYYEFICVGFINFYHLNKLNILLPITRLKIILKALNWQCYWFLYLHYVTLHLYCCYYFGSCVVSFYHLGESRIQCTYIIIVVFTCFCFVSELNVNLMNVFLFLYLVAVGVLKCLVVIKRMSCFAV